MFGMACFVLCKVIPVEKDQTLTTNAIAVHVSRGQYASGLTDVTRYTNCLRQCVSLRVHTEVKVSDLAQTLKHANS